VSLGRIGRPSPNPLVNCIRSVVWIDNIITSWIPNLFPHPQYHKTDMLKVLDHVLRIVFSIAMAHIYICEIGNPNLATTWKDRLQERSSHELSRQEWLTLSTSWSHHLPIHSLDHPPGFIDPEVRRQYVRLPGEKEAHGCPPFPNEPTAPWAAVSGTKTRPALNEYVVPSAFWCIGIYLIWFEIIHPFLRHRRSHWFAYFSYYNARLPKAAFPLLRFYPNLDIIISFC